MIVVWSILGALGLLALLCPIGWTLYKKSRNNNCIINYGMTYAEYHFRKKNNMYINTDFRKINNLSKEEMNKYNELVDSFIDGFISESEFNEKKKVILEKMKN